MLRKEDALSLPAPTSLLFPALSDPTRRGIVEILCEGEKTAGQIAAEFTISRPAVSRHLRVLRHAGLVHVRGQGTQRIYQLSPAPLADLDAWLARYRKFWAARLDDLGATLSPGSTEPPEQAPPSRPPRETKEPR